MLQTGCSVSVGLNHHEGKSNKQPISCNVHWLSSGVKKEHEVVGVAPDGAAERDTHLLAPEPAGDSTVAPPTFTYSDGLIGVYTSRGG